MARNDLLLSLVRAGVAGDRGLLRATVEALTADERAKKHHALADKLSRLIDEKNHHLFSNAAAGGGVLPGQDFIVETTAQMTLNDLILTEIVRDQANDLIEEQHRADLLRSHGLQPRHRILLSGPPGNGKTALAEAIAEALAVPFLVVRYDALIGSYLGETTQRLRKLFDYVRTTPCVLLFDEFDAIGKERGDVHETGEIKRVVSSLLLQIDALPSYAVLVVATNHAELLDRAVWRRFQLRLSMLAPTKRALAQFLASAFSKMDDASKLDIAAVAAALYPVSYAEATEFLIDLRRRHVLSLGERRFAEIIRQQLPRWVARGKVKSDGERSGEALTEVQSAKPDTAGEGRPKETADASFLHAGPAEAAARPKAQRSRKGAGPRRRPARAAE